MKLFSYFSSKTYDLGTQKNHLTEKSEMVLLSTQNGDIRRKFRFTLYFLPICTIHFSFLQAVAGLIKPMMEAPNVPQFLWDHIDADLNNLQRVFGCSIDDVFILMHSIINSMMITHNPGN